MKKVKKVVGVAFIEDGKLLIVRSVRSSKSNTWTLIMRVLEDEGYLRRVRRGRSFEWYPVLDLQRRVDCALEGDGE